MLMRKELQGRLCLTAASPVNWLSKRVYSVPMGSCARLFSSSRHNAMKSRCRPFCRVASDVIGGKVQESQSLRELLAES